MIFRKIYLLLFIPLMVSCDFVKDNDYIIEHQEEIVKLDSINYYIERPDDYYNNITIRMVSDSSFFVIFWVDRESFICQLLDDITYSVSIPYDRYKGYDISSSMEILEILNTKDYDN